ncbi:FAD-binding protein [Rhodococcus koreensis]
MLDETYDIVVVGSGSGLAAALAATESGLKTLVVEKSRYLGGSTAISGGALWIPNNSVLTEAGIQDTPERAMEYLDNLVGDTAPRDRRISFLRHGPDAVDMLRRRTPLKFSAMPGYPDYLSEVDGASVLGRSIESRPFDVNTLRSDIRLLRPGALSAPLPMPVTSLDYRRMVLFARTPGRSLPVIAKRLAQGIGGRVLGRNYVAGGRALVAGMIAGARRSGVAIWTQAALQDLVIENDRVVGVKVIHEGKEHSVAARRGVLLAGGGFDHNIEMRREYQSSALDKGWSLASPSNKGEVIQIAEAAGAALTLMDQSWWAPIAPPVGDLPPVMLLAERSLPGSMIVDGTGKRFFNESCDYMGAGQIMLGLDDGRTPHLPAWMIFDQAYRNRYVFGGGIMPGQPFPKSWYSAGRVHKASTIGELAGTIRVPGLVSEVERFNLMADQGHDDDFHRGLGQYDRYYGDPSNLPNPNLRALTKGPFYAMQVAPGDIGTCGGVEADRYGRALRTDGSVIEGLYAFGNAAGNAFGHFYPGAGGTIGPAVVYGYIAAMHAAGKLVSDSVSSVDPAPHS